MKLNSLTPIIGVAASMLLLMGCTSSSNYSVSNDTIAADTSLTFDTAVVDNQLSDSVSDAEKAENASRVKELKPFFRTKKDEFDNEGKTWYFPKTAPKYVNANGIYLYFQVIDGRASNLRLVIQHYADDWLFWKQAYFNVDGATYTYVPRKTETDNGDGGMIWEWSDEQVTAIDQSLIISFLGAKSIKVKLEGRQYYKVKTLTSEQIKSLNRSYKLYKALGGKIN